MLGCASASDVNQTDDMSILEDTNNDEILTEDMGTFSELNDTIINSQTKTIELTKNYTYDEGSDADDSGIILTSNMIIDGKGHTINGNNKARIFNVQSGPVTIENTIFINAKYTDGGGAINADGASIILKNCTFISNQGKFAGTVYAKSVTIENCTFTKNKGTNSVGAVSAEKGVVTDCKFSENEGSNIGALKLDNGKTFNSEFIKNLGKWSAGAIYYKSGSTTENCIFIGNRVYQDTFYFGEGSGAIHQLYRDSQRIVNCTFINNTDNDADGNPSEYYHNNEITYRFLIKNDAEIINCTFVNTKVICRYTEFYYSVKSFHVLFENNTFIDSKVNLSDCIASFSRNTFDGGFISNNGATITSPTYFEVPNYVQKPENTLILARMTDDVGNTIYDHGYIKDCFNFLVDNEEFSNIDYVKINDIWYYLVNTTLPEGNYSARVALTNETGLKQYYENCTLVSGTLRVGDIANFTELENEIHTQGSVITLEKDFALNITDESGYGNGIVIDTDNVIIDGKGHSISGSSLARIFNIAGNNVTLKNITFENGKAQSGGAIIASGKITLEDCRFINNNALNGGAVYLSDGTITNCHFVKNTASENGGAVNMNTGNILNSIFTGNVASQKGGAIYINEGNITNCTFTRNSANNGGAIYFNNKGKVIETNFSYNNAEEAGAIYFNNEGTVVESNFSHNNASDGTLYFKEKGNITNSTLENNTAKSGVIIAEDLLTITNSTFENNTLEEANIDIVLRNDGEVVLENTHPADLKAKYLVSISAWTGYTEIGTPVLIDVYLTSETGNINHGYVTLTLNGKDYIEYVEDGHAQVAINDLDAGQYTATVTYNGGDNYSQPSTEVDFEVYSPTVTPTITVSNANYVITKAGTFSVKMNFMEYPIDDVEVILVVNNALIASGTTGNDGIARIQLTPEILKSIGTGTHDIISIFEGNSYLDPVRMITKLTITKDNPQIVASSASYVINYGGKYVTTLKDSSGKAIAGKKVTFTLNGKQIATATTNAKGVATIKITAKMLKTAKAGKKNLVIKFTDSSYNTASKTVKVTIKKEKTKITAKKKTFKKSKKVKKYTITLKNSKGKAIKKAKVTLTIKKKKYTATTNKKGKAVFKIKKLTKKGK